MELATLVFMTFMTGFFLGVITCCSAALYIDKIKEVQRKRRVAAHKKNAQREIDEATAPDSPSTILTY